MTELRPLLEEIQTFIRERDISESRFGLMVVNDNHLVSRLRAGTITFRTIEKVRAFLRSAESEAERAAAANGKEAAE
jgi:acetylglutamate kinase